MAHWLPTSITDFEIMARDHAEEVRATYGELTAQELNWKPDANAWSIAQCLDHLLTANATYFPTFEAVVHGRKTTTFWERLPGLPSLWGKMLVKSVAPESARKLKAPQIFQPASSDISTDIVPRFGEQQDRLLHYLQATGGMDLDGIIITSPVAKFITYSLRDTFRILFLHERRHLNQAQRVLKASRSEAPA